MSGYKEQIEAAGASLLAVGNGSALMASDFVESFEVDFPVYTDPSRATYKLVGFKRTALFFGPRTYKHNRRATKAGFRQGRVAGDPWQQGGDVIVAPGDNVLYCRASSGPGDHASLEELLSVLAAYGRSESQ
jgi:hypothetical protein